MEKTTQNTTPTMFCSHCGKQISQESAFCPFCGKPLSAVSTEKEEKESSSILKKGGKVAKGVVKTLVILMIIGVLTTTVFQLLPSFGLAMLHKAHENDQDGTIIAVIDDETLLVKHNKKNYELHLIGITGEKASDLQKYVGCGGWIYCEDENQNGNHLNGFIQIESEGDKYLQVLLLESGKARLSGERTTFQTILNEAAARGASK